jgi:hypothetical protein
MQPDQFGKCLELISCRVTQLYTGPKDSVDFHITVIPDAADTNGLIGKMAVLFVHSENAQPNVLRHVL